jgi:hypothetical protein
LEGGKGIGEAGREGDEEENERGGKLKEEKEKGEAWKKGER